MKATTYILNPTIISVMAYLNFVWSGKVEWASTVKGGTKLRCKSIHYRGGAPAAPFEATPRRAIAEEASAPGADEFAGADGHSPRLRRGRADGRSAAAAAPIYWAAKPARRSPVLNFFIFYFYFEFVMVFYKYSSHFHLLSTHIFTPISLSIQFFYL